MQAESHAMLPQWRGKPDRRGCILPRPAFEDLLLWHRGYLNNGKHDHLGVDDDFGHNLIHDSDHDNLLSFVHDGNDHDNYDNDSCGKDSPAVMPGGDQGKVPRQLHRLVQRHLPCSMSHGQGFMQ
jgi:hypothetical protein